MKKILIITLPQGANYGGMLQAYALQSVLRGMGHDVESTFSTGVGYKRLIKSFPGAHRLLLYVKRRARGISDQKIVTENTNKFIEQNVKLVEFNRAVFNATFGKYDVYISGSDQVWRKSYTYVPHNLFSFVQKRAIKISYAASFGQDNLSEYGDKLVAKTRNLAHRFDAISTRETGGISICENYWGVKAEWHMDPTLLVSGDTYAELVSASSIPINKSPGGVFSYVLDTAPDKQNIAKIVADTQNLEVFRIIDGDENSGKPMPPVAQWLQSFIDAEFIVTDSFHGTVFSIIFNKPFIAIGNKSRGLARFTSLLNIFDLEHRLVTSEDEVTETLITEKIDWKPINQIIKREQKRSNEYLRKYTQ